MTSTSVRIARSAVRRARKATKGLINGVVYSRYDWARAHYLAQLKRRVADCSEELLVFQMGKVGSSTVTAALRAALPDAVIYHVHALEPTRLSEAEQRIQREWRQDPESPHGVWQSQYLLQRMETAPPGTRWKVITLIRDPIARNISAFFEGLDPRQRFGYREKVEKLGLDAVVEELKLVWTTYGGHERPLTWFDEQLAPAFGVDVFATPFTNERGVARYVGDRADLLLLKLERLDEVGPAALGEFVGTGEVALGLRRASREKYYAPAYDRFRRSRFLTPEYVERMYSSRMARHFYTDEELAAFRVRWSGCIHA